MGRLLNRDQGLSQSFEHLREPPSLGWPLFERKSVEGGSFSPHTRVIAFPSTVLYCPTKHRSTLLPCPQPRLLPPRPASQVRELKQRAKRLEEANAALKRVRPWHLAVNVVAS